MSDDGVQVMQILLRSVAVFGRVVEKVVEVLTALMGEQKYGVLSSRIRKVRWIMFFYYLLSSAIIIRFVEGDSLWSIKPLEQVRFSAPDRDDSVGHFVLIWRRGIYDKYEVSKGQVVFDAGAHIGIYATRASREVGEDGIVVAVEPHPLNFKLLRRNIEANNCQNVICVNAALASSCGEIPLFLGARTVGHSTFLRGNSHVCVRSTTLDKLVKDLELPRVHLVKINVEGATRDVLEGAESTLRLQKPRIIATVGHYPAEKEETMNFLRKKGYIPRARYDFVHAEPEYTSL